MTTVLILAGAAIVLFLTFLIYNYYKMKNTPEAKTSKKILQVNNKNFKHLTRTGTVLIDFWASWCAPCKLMTPILNEIAEKEDNGVIVGKVNVDQNRVLAKKYKIRSIPTMIVFQDGREVSRLVGVKSKRAVLKEIERSAED
jgi:thioredoxin 1